MRNGYPKCVLCESAEAGLIQDPLRGGQYVCPPCVFRERDGLLTLARDSIRKEAEDLMDSGIEFIDGGAMAEELTIPLSIVRIVLVELAEQGVISKEEASCET